MRTIREAASLLSRVRDAGDVAAILPALGFGGVAGVLDAESVGALGLGQLARHARVARGSGTLRAIIIEPRGGIPLREAVRKAAERLSRTSPHVLWLLVVFDPRPRTLAIAAWSAAGALPRTAALILELDRVLNSDAETLCSLAAIRDSIDVLVHTRWVELLGRDALTRRFYRTLEQLVHSMASAMSGRVSRDDRMEIALLHVSRLLFLSFLEAKGWLNGERGFLVRSFDECMERGGDYQTRILCPLYFGTLNTPPSRRARAARAFGHIPFLNGGLFSRTTVEKLNRTARIPDERFGALFRSLLGSYRFTAREDSTAWSEAAIDPEMLGKAFESLMAARARHATGAFYTPQSMVEQVVSSVLLRAVCSSSGARPEQVEAALTGEWIGPDMAHRLHAAAAGLRVLDPACGSGAFLVHILERIADLLVAAGDRRPVATVRRGVLSASVFGVDINPTAVWLCELRLWLSIVIDSEESDAHAVPPLPNLDHNIRVGDSLAGGGLDSPIIARHDSPALSSLRERYVRATGRRKQQLAHLLDRDQRRRALEIISSQLDSASARRKELIAAQRSRDLFGDRTHRSHTRLAALDELREFARRLRTAKNEIARGGALPFSFGSHFPEAASAGGFDIVLGNPPWVRIERVPAEARALMRRQFDVFRLAGWEPASGAERTGPGFAAQVDLSAIFIERSLSLLHKRGYLALVVPAKLWRSLAGSGVRRLIERDAEVLELSDWSSSSAGFDAVVYPSVLIARRRDGSRSEEPVVASLHTRSQTLRWSLDPAALALEDSPGAPWLIVPSEVRAAFEDVRRAGAPLGSSRFGPCRLGVKCGCNHAFAVHLQALHGAEARVQSGALSGRIESSLLRPVARGQSVSRWRIDAPREHILWTHGPDAQPLPVLPALARRWLGRFRQELARRADMRGGSRWWMLFRTDAARSDVWRVIWPDIGRAPRAAVLEPGNPIVPLNSCYVALLQNEPDALALAALLNSSLASAWLNVLAEQARGGYHRYFAWTMSLLPLPHDWQRAREILAPCALRAMQGSTVPDAELLDAVLEAYLLGHDDVAPLLTWNAR